MLRRLSLVALPAAAVLAIFYVAYRLVDPLPPRRLVMGAGIAGSGYDNFARRYARILARHGIDLEIRNTAGAVENLSPRREGQHSWNVSLDSSFLWAAAWNGRCPINGGTGASKPSTCS
jgi:uncharacterized protein